MSSLAGGNGGAAAGTVATATTNAPLAAASAPAVADKPVVIVLLDSDGYMTRVGDANRIKRWMESAGLVLERRTI